VVAQFHGQLNACDFEPTYAELGGALKEATPEPKWGNVGVPSTFGLAD